MIAIQELRPLPRWARCKFVGELFDLDGLWRSEPTAYRARLLALLARVEAARLARKVLRP